MKQFLLLLLFTSYFGFSQEFSSIEKITKDYPKHLSSEALAKKIASDFKSKESQVKAIFNWVSKNISYDLDNFRNPKQKRIRFRYRNEAEKQQKINEIKNEIVDKTLTTRKAVCEGYAQTVAKICNLLNIENEVIKGYVRNSLNDINNVRNITNHAWNAIKINDKWIYIDATWAAGAVFNGKWQRRFNPYFYDIPKEKYFKTHLPENTLWQLRVGRITKEGYYNQPIYESSFLKSDLELISPKQGVLNNKKAIELKIKNLKPHQKVLFGFSGYQYAKKPDDISYQNNISTIKITPPQNTRGLYLIIDNEVMLEFLIK
ncbi:transglutaminase [Tenacibaculum sp. S7007]|uniref:Transglutaminase n=1 Tax=Tenacibaculum pelagium TaxID=2759527 RepID=A0A839AMJ7_9FLAO|nr:transglutaminase domain-containing protein [Tenacibaculum pelagium]MBA6155618.1 transglutaminase [Tenacibaculum pelagium]